MPLFADRRISGNRNFSARTATHLAAKDLLHKNIMKFTEVTVTTTLLTRILARLIGRGTLPLIKCNSGSRVDTVAAVQQMALVTSEPLPWVNKPGQGKQSHRLLERPYVGQY